MSKTVLSKSDYYPAPFWFLNHKLEKPELLRQLKLMKEQNISAFFMHPRAGLRTPYASREWFDLIRYTATEADKLGMKAWLYDEDPFPSGPAGGRIFLEHPEFAARQLRYFELEADENGQLCVDLGEGKLLEAQALRLDADGNVIEKRDLFEDVGMLRDELYQAPWYNSYYHHLTGKVKFFHYRAETFYPHLQINIPLEKNWIFTAVTAETRYTDSKYRYLPDNLNPECVKEFIKWTHDLYEKHLGDLLGRVIPGIFTDETAPGGVPPWTPKFSDEFRKRRNLDLNGNYYRIFRGSSEEDRVFRNAYWLTAHEMFIEAFFIPVNQWCKDHNMLLCGHGIGEELPLASTKNIFDIQKYTGIPGFDHITANIPNWSNFTSLNLGGKLVASAAEQMGEHRVMTECFACNAYNFGHDGMKKNLAWLYSLGINWAIPHGFHYSYDGFRKDDAGKSFFFQSPDYDRFHKFGSFAANLGFRLGESRSTADVCIVYPESVFRERAIAESQAALDAVENLYATVQYLLQKQIQFELADEITLRNAEIVSNGFKCGKKVYRQLVLPFDGLQRDYLDKLQQFIVKKETAQNSRSALVINADTKTTANTVITQFRSTPHGNLLYFFHNSDTPGKFKIETSGQYAAIRRLDIENDRLYDFPADGVISLMPYGAALLEFFDSPQSEAAPYPEQLNTPDFTYMTDPQWDYIPEIPGLSASISEWKYSSPGEEDVVSRYNVMKYIFGWEKVCSKRLLMPRAIFDQSPERKRFYPAQITAAAEFELPQFSKCKLIAENSTFSGNCRITINGKLIPALQRELVYDPWNCCGDVSTLVKPGKNIIEVQWDNAGEDDGICSFIYFAIEK